MKNATLRQLKVFETVARHLSFSRAAEELHLTQPAVSTQVKQLQDHVGLPLLEQLGKKIYLTTAGRELLQHSRTIIHQFKEAEEAFAVLRGISGGQLKVAVISAGYFFPRLLAEFCRRYSNVSVQLLVNNREAVLRQLADNEIDIAIMGRQPQTADLVAAAFAPHPYVLIAAPDHPLAQRRRIALKTVLNEKFIVRERGSDTHTTMREVFGRRASSIHTVMEIKSNETVKQAVAVGMGISFISLHTITHETRDRQLVLLDVQGFPVINNWYVVHRKNKRLPPVAAAFKEFLLNEGEKLIADAVPAYRTALNGRK
jgi:DNA-binding transcriptional LysR family regulator